MENINKKINFINNALNNILFYDGKLYKIIKVNTANIYAFEYILYKKLEINVSVMFYNIGDKVNYYNLLQYYWIFIYSLIKNYFMIFIL